MLLILKEYFVKLQRSASAHIARLISRRQVKSIADLDGLQQFLESRASHVTQTALYGYLRTRAGSRYPELFANDDYAKAINAAKWNIWLACVSDLAIYAGGLIARRSKHEDAVTARVMRLVIENILATGVPPESDSAYSVLVTGLRARVNTCTWNSVPDNDAAFSESPDALVRWAPIVDQLKQLDEEIVKNSVRFRWQEVRQDLRRLLDVDALLTSVATVQEAW
jgi:hypothetical protein